MQDIQTIYKWNLIHSFCQNVFIVLFNLNLRFHFIMSSKTYEKLFNLLEWEVLHKSLAAFQTLSSMKMKNHAARITLSMLDKIITFYS